MDYKLNPKVHSFVSPINISESDLALNPHLACLTCSQPSSTHDGTETPIDQQLRRLPPEQAPRLPGME